jgi:hypothetical protein
MDVLRDPVLRWNDTHGKERRSGIVSILEAIAKNEFVDFNVPFLARIGTYHVVTLLGAMVAYKRFGLDFNVSAFEALTADDFDKTLRQIVVEEHGDAMLPFAFRLSGPHNEPSFIQAYVPEDAREKVKKKDKGKGKSKSDTDEGDDVTETEKGSYDKRRTFKISPSATENFRDADDVIAGDQVLPYLASIQTRAWSTGGNSSNAAGQTGLRITVIPNGSMRDAIIRDIGLWLDYAKVHSSDGPMTAWLLPWPRTPEEQNRPLSPLALTVADTLHVVSVEGGYVTGRVVPREGKVNGVGWFAGNPNVWRGAPGVLCQVLPTGEFNTYELKNDGPISMADVHDILRIMGVQQYEHRKGKSVAAPTACAQEAPLGDGSFLLVEGMVLNSNRQKVEGVSHVAIPVAATIKATSEYWTQAADIVKEMLVEVERVETRIREKVSNYHKQAAYHRSGGAVRDFQNAGYAKKFVGKGNISDRKLSEANAIAVRAVNDFKSAVDRIFFGVFSNQLFFSGNIIDQWSEELDRLSKGVISRWCTKRGSQVSHLYGLAMS